MPSPRPLAAFDFDGTLIRTDSFVRFLLFVSSRWRLAAILLARPEIGLGYLLTRDRGALKARLLYAVTGPILRAELNHLYARFAEAEGAALFRKDALEAWEKHRADRHDCVIVTASPEELVRAVSVSLKPDAVIGTRLAFDDEDRLLPRTEGLNCRGGEKVVRLRAQYPDAEIVAAYGDTKGDREMLAAALKPGYRVFKL